MKQNIILFIKGLIIGIGKIIPGVSGSVLAILLGIYDKGIYALSHLQTEFRKNFFFLFKIGLGIFVSIVFGSRFILSLLEHCYFTTMLLFCGLIAGTVPTLLKKGRERGTNNYKITILVFVFFTLFSFVQFQNLKMVLYTWKDFLFFILVGFIEASTMIIPGISGTAILMLLGVYPLILTMFSHLFTLSYLQYNLFIICPFLIGIVLGFLTITKIVYYAMKKYKEKTYAAILGFSLSSLFLLFQKTFTRGGTLIEYSTGFLLFIVGFLISLYFDEK